MTAKLLLHVAMLLDEAEVASLDRMASASDTTRSGLVQAVMREVIADEMADQASEAAE